MDKHFLIEALQAATHSSSISEELKIRAKKEYFELEKERQNYDSLKNQSLLFINEYNSLVEDDTAELLLDDNDFLVTIIFTNYDLDSNDIKDKLTEKYLKNYTKNISFKYKPNAYYSSLY